MEWQHAHGRSWLGIVTVAGLWLAASFLAAPDARATDGAVEQIEQIADDATNAIGDRADAYLDFLATGPDRAQAQSELMTAAGEIELLAADADAAITGMMVLHPLDGDVQEAGADTKVEVREAAADTEAIMSAAYAVFVAQNPTTTTTTTTTSTSTTTSAPPTTTTTTAATAATAPPTTTTTTTTSSTTTTTATAQVSSASTTTLAAVVPPSTTTAAAGGFAAGGAAIGTLPEPSIAQLDALPALDQAPAPERDGVGPIPQQSLGALALQVQSARAAAGERDQPRLALPAPRQSRLSGALEFIRVRLPRPVNAPLVDVFTIIRAFGLALVSGSKVVALPAAAFLALILARAVAGRASGRWKWLAAGR